MIARALMATSLVLATASADAAPRKPAHAPVRHDWANSVVRLPDGAYLLGNPAARVKLVEYLSLTCSHCAHFATDGLPVLRRDYIAKGNVSIAFRHAVRDGFDFAASLLARCGGAGRYLGDLDALFRAQPAWLGRAQSFTPPADASPAALPALFARGVGLDTLMTARGLPPQRAAACLADKTDQARLTAMRTEAFETRGLEATPSFLLNGRLTGVYGWETLQPLIDAALRR